MKRVFPFYTFIRKNVPLQIEKIAEHPEVYNKVTNAYKSAGKNLETERERDVKPGEYNSRIPIGGGKYLNLSLPMFDADKASSPSDLYNMSNPLLKLAPELVMGKNSFTGGDIDNTGKHILESLIPSTKGIKAPVNIKSLDVPLRERQMLYEYLNKLQKQYYSAKNDGIIKEENGGQANTTSGIKSDPLKMLLQNSKKAKAKTKR
jgi:hypothetical protein